MNRLGVKWFEIASSLVVPEIEDFCVTPSFLLQRRVLQTRTSIRRERSLRRRVSGPSQPWFSKAGLNNIHPRRKIVRRYPGSRTRCDPCLINRRHRLAIQRLIDHTTTLFPYHAAEHLHSAPDTERRTLTFDTVEAERSVAVETAGIDSEPSPDSL